MLPNIEPPVLGASVCPLEPATVRLEGIQHFGPRLVQLGVEQVDVDSDVLAVKEHRNEADDIVNEIPRDLLTPEHSLTQRGVYQVGAKNKAKGIKNIVVHCMVVEEEEATDQGGSLC